MKLFTRARKNFKKRDFFLGLFAFGILILSIVLFWMSTLTIPDISAFENRQVAESTKIYDRTGDVLLYDVHGSVKRSVVDSDEISENIKEATVAVEDQNFYSHPGVDLPAIFRALVANIKAGGIVQGGSTISQQVIKNSLLSKDQTLTRKVKEAVLALKLETVYDKDEILTIYLNEIPYGGTIYGIEEAAQAFYSKPATELTVAESAYLAAIPQAPTYFSPHGNHLDELEARKNKVINNMRSLGFITDEEYEEALDESVDFNDVEERGIKAPHFVMYVLSYLEDEYGEEAVRKNGLRITTTIDWELQEEAERIAEEYGHRNEELFNSENTSVVATDPGTGQILAMVGSRDYFDSAVDGNVNNAIREHQPGSSFKPFVYATAFEKGYTPDTILYDVRTQFSTSCSPSNMTSDNGCYSPRNYDLMTRGPVTIREALAQSMNIPAVKTLYLAGINDSIETATDMGISTLGTDQYYGLSLVLGAGDVTLLDMTNAYGAFATGGIYHEPIGILEVVDSKGNTLEEFEENGERVIDENIALQVSDILSDNAARTPAYGSNSPLYFGGRSVAVKTGTTNDYRDVWTVGYTEDIAIGVWGGNNDNTSMEKRVAGMIISPMWREVMDQALANGYDTPSFKRPNIDYSEITKPVLRGELSGGRVQTAFSDRRNTSQRPHSILHWVDKNNPRGPTPANPSQDPQYLHWEYGVQAWLGVGNPDSEDEPSSTVSGDIDVDGLDDSYDDNDRIRFTVDIDDFEVDYVEVLINSAEVDDSSREPYRFSLDLEDFTLFESNMLTVIAHGEDGEVLSESYEFEVD